MIFKNLSLRLKFIIGLVMSALGLGLCVTVIMYLHFNSVLESEISQRSRLVLAMSDAVQNYVKTELRPEMFDSLPEGRFILKAMSSSYISRQVMARLNKQDDLEYHYSRVARNPRNKRDTPSLIESELIRHFNQHPDISIVEDDAMVDGVAYHIVARPVIFTQSCMNCHGAPKDAPVELLKTYGNTNGFFHTTGEIGGVVVAGFPVEQIKMPAREISLQYLCFYLLGILFFSILISFFFDRLVMKNLMTLTTIFKTRFSGKREQQIIERFSEKDEIEGLIEGVDELAGRLAQARDELEYQNDMLQSVFEGISDPLLLIDQNGKIIMANKGSRKILFKERKSEREEELLLFLAGGPDRSRKNREEILNDLLKQGHPVSQEITAKNRKSFRVYLYPLPRHGSAEPNIVVYAREITMEKQMMVRMRQAERLSAIGKMAAGVAHEINNPLGVISCYTDLVKDAVDQSETLEDLNIIEKHTQSVKKVVQELLKLSRPKKILSGKCDINHLVKDTAKVFKAQAASKDIRLFLDLADELPDIHCDAAIAEQVLTNVWLNAFDAVQESGGDVTIRTRLHESGDVCLSIEDNGPGIESAVIDKIFDPFFTTKEPGKGTGLGLAVVYGFINELGGQIEVDCNHNTVFHICFPIEEDQQQ